MQPASDDEVKCDRRHETASKLAAADAAAAPAEPEHRPRAKTDRCDLSRVTPIAGAHSS